MFTLEVIIFLTRVLSVINYIPAVGLPAFLLVVELNTWLRICFGHTKCAFARVCQPIQMCAGHT